MPEQVEKIAGEMEAGIMAKHEVKYNVRIALKYYRFLNAFVSNAVDSMDFYISDNRIPASVKAIAESRAETMVILTHINTAIETYRMICKADNCEEKAKVIIYKFIDPPSGCDGYGKPYSNEELAELFNRNTKTINAWIREGYEKISILLFGFNALKNK